MTARDTYATIKNLRATRFFLSKPLERADLEAILEAGRWTGSSKNVQGWTLVVFEDAAGRERIATAGDFTNPVRNSVATIALVKNPEGNDFDIGRLAQNLMLAAATRGVGSCPVTLHHTDVAREVLGLSDGQSCKYAVAFGYPDPEAEEASRAKRRAAGTTGRKPAEDMIRRDG
ncbi:MAG: nitroreductase family protein, partial [Actinomycetota bacterium]